MICSEKNKGDAGIIASSVVQNIFLNQNVYSSPELSKWESYKSNTVSERCFFKTAVLQNHELQNNCSCNVEKILVEK